MKNRILIIASYNGLRRWSLPNAVLLQKQHECLNKYKHNLDKILVVQNESSDYPPELGLFDNVIYRPNEAGSYGAWIEGYNQNPDYEWYFFIEDDYVFVHDNFDQHWIDLWDEETSYLCSLYRNGHAAIANGLTRGDILKRLNITGFAFSEIYNAQLQINFSQVFSLLPDKMIKDISSTYCSPFWQQGIYHLDEKPILIEPTQKYIAGE